MGGRVCVGWEDGCAGMVWMVGRVGSSSRGMRGLITSFDICISHVTFLMTINEEGETSEFLCVVCS